MQRGNPLGMALQDAIKGPGFGMPPFYPQGTPIVPQGGFGGLPPNAPQGGTMVPQGAPPTPQTAGPEPYKPSKGQMIIGILSDALRGAAGGPALFAQHLGKQRDQEREQVQWQSNRTAGLEDYEARQRIEQRYKQADVSPMVRDATAWAGMTPEMRAAYREAQAAKPQFIPDGLGGGQWAQPPMGGAPKPGLTFTPLPDTGGPAPKAPGTFR